MRMTSLNSVITKRTEMKIHITHDDLDGVGCAVVSKAVYPDIKIVHASYGNFAEKLNEALDKEPELLLISDVWDSKLSQDVSNKLENRQNTTIIFDHHKSSESSQSSFALRKNIHLKHDSAICATYIMWRHFSLIDESKSWDKLKRLGDMVEAVNHFDTTGTILGVPGDLNTLFWERKIPYMKGMLTRYPFKFTKAEEHQLNRIQEKRDSYYNRVIGKADSYYFKNKSLMILQANQHRNYIFQTLLRNFSCVIINSKTTNSVSIRSKDGTARLLAETLGGGGHPQAAGVSKYYHNAKLVKAFKSTFI